MNSFVIKLKRFFGNKNTVTILCVIAGIAVLYFGYQYRVSSKINPVRVPYAIKSMEARHVITASDIGYIEINSDIAKKATNIVKNAKDIIDKEVTYGNKIDAGSLIYKEDITTPSLAPDYVLNDIKDGYTAFSLSVDTYTTYGNVIEKGDYIDLWFNGKDDNKKIIYTNLLKGVQVLDVRDSKGVSLSNNNGSKPSELLFAVKDDTYSLLVKATKAGTLVPVPRNKNYTAQPGETEAVSDYVKTFILSKAATIPDEDTSTTNNTNE